MSQADIFSATLHAQLGEPYLLGAEGPNSHDCSGLHWEGMHAAGVLWKGRPFPRLTANDYKNMARPLPAGARLKVGDPCFFLGRATRHAYHVVSFVGYDQQGVGWTIEARGVGVAKYRVGDPRNGVTVRGGIWYRYPGIDLGALTEDDMTPEQDNLLKRTWVSQIACSHDMKIIKARLDGSAQVPALEAEKARDVAAWRAKLKLPE